MVELGDIFFNDFITTSPTTGNVVDADSVPTVEVFEDDNDTPILSYDSVKRVSKTGNYRVRIAATTANGYEVGKSYNVVVTAIVEGVTSKVVSASFYLRDAMTKLTDAALRVTTAIPDYFTPTGMAAAPAVVQSPQELYFDNTDFQDKWDVAEGEWKTTADVDPVFVTTVETAQADYNVYVLAKRDWDQEYNIQKEVQWKALVGQKFIDGTD